MNFVKKSIKLDICILVLLGLAERVLSDALQLGGKMDVLAYVGS